MYFNFNFGGGEGVGLLGGGRRTRASVFVELKGIREGVEIGGLSKRKLGLGRRWLFSRKIFG